MALKKASSKKVVSNESRVEELKLQIRINREKIASLEGENIELRRELLDLQIAPFKIGGYAMAEVCAGKSKKVQKCLLECELGTLYIRPIKNNGELSGRHFSICPVGDQKYSDFLKPVEE